MLRRVPLVLVAALSLSACPSAPKYSTDFDVPFARAYWTSPPERRPPAGAMTMEQLYAAHEYGQRAFHPQRGMEWAFACRADEAVPFLKGKIRKDTVASLIGAFTTMQDIGTWDPAQDPELVRQIRAAYDQLHKGMRKSLAGHMAQLEGRGQAWPFPHLPRPDFKSLRAIRCSELGDPAARW